MTVENLLMSQLQEVCAETLPSPLPWITAETDAAHGEMLKARLALA